MSAVPEAARFALDADVLVYAVDVEAGPRHERARRVLALALGRPCVPALQSLGEFYAAATRERRATRAEAAEQVRDWIVLFQIVAPEAADVEAALAAAEAGRFSYRDALLLATLGRAGCAALLSEDMGDGSSLAGVTVLDPFAGGGDDVPPAVARLLGAPAGAGP